MLTILHPHDVSGAALAKRMPPAAWTHPTSTISVSALTLRNMSISSQRSGESPHLQQMSIPSGARLRVGRAPPARKPSLCQAKDKRLHACVKRMLVRTRDSMHAAQAEPKTWKRSHCLGSYSPCVADMPVFVAKGGNLAVQSLGLEKQ